MNVQCGSSAATVFVFSDLLTFLDIFGFDHSSYLEKKLFGAKSVFCVQTRHCEILAEGVVFFWFCAFVCFTFFNLIFFFPLVQLKPKSSFSFRAVPLSLVCQSVCSHHLSVPHLRLWSGSSSPRHRRSSKSRKHVAAASVRVLSLSDR